VTSNYFIKFPVLHKNYQQIKIKPSQQNILLNNYSNLLKIKPKIHDISMIITTFMTPPHLTDRLHLSPFYNHILIDIGDLNNPMTPSEIEEGDHLLIPNKNPRSCLCPTFSKRNQSEPLGFQAEILEHSTTQIVGNLSNLSNRIPIGPLGIISDQFPIGTKQFRLVPIGKTVRRVIND